MNQDHFIGESTFDIEEGFAIIGKNLIDIKFSSIHKTSQQIKQYRWDIKNPLLSKFPNLSPSGLLWNFKGKGGQSGAGVFIEGQLMGFLSAHSEGRQTFSLNRDNLADLESLHETLGKRQITSQLENNILTMEVDSVGYITLLNFKDLKSSLLAVLEK